MGGSQSVTDREEERESQPVSPNNDPQEGYVRRWSLDLLPRLILGPMRRIERLILRYYSADEDPNREEERESQPVSPNNDPQEEPVRPNNEQQQLPDPSRIRVQTPNMTDEEPDREEERQSRSRRNRSSFLFLPPPMAERKKEEESRSMRRSRSLDSLPPPMTDEEPDREEEEESLERMIIEKQRLRRPMSELRVVLLWNSWSERSSVGNFILGETKFSTEEEPDHCAEDFTEGQKLRLCRDLQCFHDESFDHSLIVISTPREESSRFMETYRQHPPLKDMIKKCKYRFLWRKDTELPELLTRLGQVVKENNGEYVKPSWL